MKFVIGYASLLSETSIGRLFPNVRKITQVKLFGYARCFNSYGTLSVDKGLVNAKDKCVSHASAIIHPDTTMYALAFQLDEKDFNTFEKHEFRSEAWTLISGEGIVTLDEEEILLKEGQSIVIPVGSIHRLENNNKTLLELIEVQTGTYFGEDDITRYDDIYGRS